MNARELLDIAAEYVEGRQVVAHADGYGASPSVDLDEIAGRWETALDAYVTRRSGRN